MHRGWVILGAVVGGALAVGAATQVASWSPDATGWDGYGPTGPTIEPTPQPMPADYTMPPECQDEWEAAMREGRVREAQETGSTAFAISCVVDQPPPEECEPGDEHVFLPREGGRSGSYVMVDCRD